MLPGCVCTRRHDDEVITLVCGPRSEWLDLLAGEFGMGLDEGHAVVERLWRRVRTAHDTAVRGHSATMAA